VGSDGDRDVCRRDRRRSAAVYPEPPVQALSLTMPKAGVIFGLSTATVYELRKQSDGTWVKTNLSSYDGGMDRRRGR